MTTDTRTHTPFALIREQSIPQTQLLLMAALLGAVVGVLFIFVQPWFGMDTLTSRHAAAYQQLGGWSAIPALVIAWLAHLAVSVFYGLASGIVVLKIRQFPWVAFYTLAFSWITTVIAPPANALIVQLVSFQHLEPGKLPALNFSLDVKLLLHLVFFAAIVLALYLYKRNYCTAEVSQ